MISIISKEKSIKPLKKFQAEQNQIVWNRVYYGFSESYQKNKRNRVNYEGIVLPKTIKGVMSMTNNKEFNFYKSFDIDNINAGILALHPSVHAFWTNNR